MSDESEKAEEDFQFITAHNVSEPDLAVIKVWFFPVLQNLRINSARRAVVRFQDSTQASDYRNLLILLHLQFETRYEKPKRKE